MRITVLGCGPSGGVPLVGCDCRVCRGDEPRNRRLRPSILVENAGTRILVDASPDLRAQLLGAGISTLDAVIFTHAHADHTHGIDDLRAINHHIDAPLAAYGDAPTLAALEARFGYAFAPIHPGYGWYKPQLAPREVTGPFRIGAIDVTPFHQRHGRGATLGLRFGDFAYSTDVKTLDEDAFATLDGTRVWLVDCLRPTPNPVHSHLAQTLEWIARLRPARGILTHMGHELDYAELVETLPPGVEPAFDGMVIEV